MDDSSQSSSESGDDNASTNDDEIDKLHPPAKRKKDSDPDDVVDDPFGGGKGYSSGPLQFPPGPLEHDVLVGRGKPYQNYPGNKRMLQVIAQFKDEYSSRPRDQKRLYVETVLDEVLKEGTKFLRLVKGKDGANRWEEVGRTVAAEKVWHALRSKEGQNRKAKRSKTKENNQDSETTAQNTSSSTTTPMDMPTVDALMADIQLNLSKAIEATNSLASIIMAVKKAPMQAPTDMLGAPPPPPAPPPLQQHQQYPQWTIPTSSAAAPALQHFLPSHPLSVPLNHVPGAPALPNTNPIFSSSMYHPSTLAGLAFPASIDHLNNRNNGGAGIVGPPWQQTTTFTAAPTSTPSTQQSTIDQQSQALRQAFESLVQAPSTQQSTIDQQSQALRLAFDSLVQAASQHQRGAGAAGASSSRPTAADQQQQHPML